MTPRKITLEVTSAAQEAVIRKALLMVQELEAVSASAPVGKIFDVCEQATVEKGRDLTRSTLETIVQEHVASQEKKGRRFDDVAVVENVKIAARKNGECKQP